MKGKAMKDNVISETDVTTNQTKIAARNVQVFYGDTHAIKDVSVDIQDKTVTAFIGPSGCGKTRLARLLPYPHVRRTPWEAFDDPLVA